jgi:hypothetical protein
MSHVVVYTKEGREETKVVYAHAPPRATFKAPRMEEKTLRPQWE